MNLKENIQAQQNCEYPDIHISLDELIEKIKKNEEVEQGTYVYFAGKDIMYLEDESTYNDNVYLHIPTNTKIRVKYDEMFPEWTRTSLMIPGIDEEIWIGDDDNDCWFNFDERDFELNLGIEIS